MLQLDKKAKQIWRIRNAFSLLIPIIVVIALLVVKLKWLEDIPNYVIYIALGITLLIAIWSLWLSPLLHYKYFKYKMTEQELVIQSGIFVNRYIVIPFFRIQNVDTNVGPIMKQFNMKTLTVATAGGNHSIPMLPTEVADKYKTFISKEIMKEEFSND